MPLRRHGLIIRKVILALYLVSVGQSDRHLICIYANSALLGCLIEEDGT